MAASLMSIQHILWDVRVMENWENNLVWLQLWLLQVFGKGWHLLSEVSIMVGIMEENM